MQAWICLQNLSAGSAPLPHRCMKPNTYSKTDYGDWQQGHRWHKLQAEPCQGAAYVANTQQMLRALPQGVVAAHHRVALSAPLRTMWLDILLGDVNVHLYGWHPAGPHTCRSLALVQPALIKCVYKAPPCLGCGEGGGVTSWPSYICTLVPITSWPSYICTLVPLQVNLAVGPGPSPSKCCMYTAGM